MSPLETACLATLLLCGQALGKYDRGAIAGILSYLKPDSVVISESVNRWREGLGWSGYCKACCEVGALSLPMATLESQRKFSL